MIPRTILGLQPSTELYQMQFNQLAALLYRDNIRQKHQARDRLLKELTDKKAEEDRHKDALKKLDFGGQNKDPVAELLVEHLLIAPWWSPSSGR